MWPARRLTVALLSLALLLSAAALTWQLVAGLRALQRVQTDLAELQDVKYGLFNAEVWVGHAATVLSARIDRFELTADNRPRLKRNLELVLDRLFVEIDQYLRRRNATGDSVFDRLQGALRQNVQDWLLDVTELRARVPAYADAVLDELNRPETRGELRTALLVALRDAADASFTALDRGPYDAILAAWGCADAPACTGPMRARAAQLRAAALRDALLVLALVGALFLLHAVWPRFAGRGLPQPALPPEAMSLLTAATLVLLAAGVLTPMIEVKAGIDELRFSLLGEPVLFTDQVLWFQSKSIMDVVRLLIDTRAADLILVGVLITLFSLIFPTAKVIAGALYYTDFRGLRGHALVRFFALRSGKWSMADVLVVAILMAYIGFKGLVGSQLERLAGRGRGVEVLTTDDTRLQLGFFLFLAFVLASMVLSALLEARVGRRTS